jgi:hypothetical protein
MFFELKEKNPFYFGIKKKGESFYQKIRYRYLFAVKIC